MNKAIPRRLGTIPFGEIKAQERRSRNTVVYGRAARALRGELEILDTTVTE